MADKKITMSEAFAESKMITKDKKWNILGYVILNSIFGMVGVLVFFAGGLITVPMAILSLFDLYKELSRS